MIPPDTGATGREGLIKYRDHHGNHSLLAVFGVVVPGWEGGPALLL